MIAYLLIFALGFCAAVLIALIAVPAIHRRIVTLTERRLRSTVALTAAELKAERDAARARNAAENSRLTVELREERNRRGGVTIERERLALNLARAREEQADLDRRIRELSQTRDTLTAELGLQTGRAKDLQSALVAAGNLGSTKDLYIEEMTARAEVLSDAYDQAQDDIATRDRHAGMLRERIEKLRDERSALRDEVKAATNAAAELQIRLEGERARAERLEEALAARIAELSDREGELEHMNRSGRDLADRLAAETQALSETNAALRSRERQIEDLRKKLAEPLDARQNPEERFRDFGRDLATAPSRQERARTMNGRPQENAAVSRRIERLRKHHARLVGRLSEAGSGERDESLREEIAEVAAMMVDLTAAREGPSSPIHGILAANDREGDDSARLSLAERARRKIEAAADND